jgi:hypothetical protein
VIAVFPIAAPKIEIKVHRPLAEVTTEAVSRACLEYLSESAKGKE